MFSFGVCFCFFAVVGFLGQQTHLTVGVKYACGRSSEVVVLNHTVLKVKGVSVARLTPGHWTRASLVLEATFSPELRAEQGAEPC